MAGVNHVGIGGDYNGIDRVPVGLEDVSKYPEVFAALIEDGEFEWTDEELAKVSGLNLINTFRYKVKGEIDLIRPQIMVVRLPLRVVNTFWL